MWYAGPGSVTAILSHVLSFWRLVVGSVQKHKNLIIVIVYDNNKLSACPNYDFKKLVTKTGRDIYRNKFLETYLDKPKHHYMRYTTE